MTQPYGPDRPEQMSNTFLSGRFTRPDLFSHICVVRDWGGIGRPGRCRRDPFPDYARAMRAHNQLSSAKRRRGYRDAA